MRFFFVTQLHHHHPLLYFDQILLCPSALVKLPHSHRSAFSLLPRPHHLPHLPLLLSTSLILLFSCMLPWCCMPLWRRNGELSCKVSVNSLRTNWSPPFRKHPALPKTIKWKIKSKRQHNHYSPLKIHAVLGRAC